MKLEIIQPDENFYKLLLTTNNGCTIVSDLGVIPSKITTKMTHSSKNTSYHVLQQICKLACNGKLFTTKDVDGHLTFVVNIDIQHPYEWWFKSNYIDMDKFDRVVAQIAQLS